MPSGGAARGPDGSRRLRSAAAAAREAPRGSHVTLRRAAGCSVLPHLPG